MGGQTIYGAMLDEHDEPIAIYRVVGFQAMVFRRGGTDWEPDGHGTLLRRAFDSTDPWLTEDEARAITARWGLTP